MLTQTTITLAEVRHVAARQQQEARAQKAARLQFFGEFKAGYCNLFDIADWQHYVASTGLRLTTLLRCAKYAPLTELGPLLFVRAPGANSFEPYDLGGSSYVATDS